MSGILIVSKDIKKREALKKELSSGHNIHEADSIERAVSMLVSKDIDLAVIRDEKNFEITNRLRSASDIPIIDVLEEQSPSQTIDAFSAGADDVISCPYETIELVHRIKALIRRFSMTKDTQMQKYGMNINHYSRTVSFGSKTINLAKKEFKLLLTLLSDIGKVFSRETLMDIVWGLDCESDVRTVDVHIKRLREKLAENERFSISTVHGKGYKVTKVKSV